jgi:tetratricopeptide (TPR) repeat protein
MTLTNLGVLYRDMQQLSESAHASQEALDIYRQLAEDNPQAYLPYLAGTLNNLGELYYNLGVLYRDTKRLSASEQAFQEPLITFRQLAEDNPQAYLPDVALMLNNLGVLYRDTNRLSASEQALQEALIIRRQFAQDNPQAYLPDVAMTLTNLGVLKFNQGNVQQAQAYVDEALTIRRRLWEKHASAYGNDLAQGLRVKVMILLSKAGETTLVHNHLHMKVTVLLSKAGETTSICDHLQEMANVALSENLKRWAYEGAETLCVCRQ